MAHQERMFLDLPGANLKKFKLGDKVTATVSGELIELQAEVKEKKSKAENEPDFSRPPSVGIKISGKAKLVPFSENAFEKMSKEDENE